MEKLQKALQKARDQRITSGLADRDAAQGQASPAQGVSRVDAAWEALTEVKPDRKALSQNFVTSLEADRASAAFDILRTKTQLLMKKNNWTRLAITSPTASCGKTTMASNLALGFTRQTDVRVILIEFDLRRPNLSKMLGVAPTHDVSRMLTGDVPFEEQAIRIRSNAAIAMAQHASPDPTSLLLRNSTHEKLKEIEDIYAPDLLIFDLPPVLVSDDARAFLKNVDCAMIVAKAEGTSIGQIDICEREIAEQTNVLGVVLNQYRHQSDIDYGYSDYHSPAD
ncbi:MAG: CpsD/CapB family tyrosine-protein kinase [Pseudomonadota bacterium]